MKVWRASACVFVCVCVCLCRFACVCACACVWAYKRMTIHMCVWGSAWMFTCGRHRKRERERWGVNQSDRYLAKDTLTRCFFYYRGFKLLPSLFRAICQANALTGSIVCTEDEQHFDCLIWTWLYLLLVGVVIDIRYLVYFGYTSEYLFRCESRYFLLWLYFLRKWELLHIKFVNVFYYWFYIYSYYINDL